MVSANEQRIVNRFFEIVDENTAKGKPNPEYGVQAQVAKELHKTPGYINEVMKKYRTSDQNPTQIMVEHADRLKNAMVQLQKRAELIEKADDRYLRFDEKLQRTEEFENDLRTSLRELDLATEVLAEHLNKLNPDDYEEFKRTLSDLRQDMNIVKRLLSGKHSPLGFSTIMGEERNLLAEMRREDQTMNMYIDSVNSAQRVILAINNLYYGGDPDAWDDRTRDQALKWLNDNVCPMCPGFEAFLASLQKRDAYGQIEEPEHPPVEVPLFNDPIIDVASEDVLDDTDPETEDDTDEDV